ncbi:MAG: hypothetical protein JRH20_05925 [Deltaproteobacteria bacterium]|nr:hypothetical protein [Deltaproteobacteria bacterium]
MLIALATSLCPHLEPEALLQTWREAQGHDIELGLVMDPRLDLPLQRALLEEAPGGTILQLCVPEQDTRGRPHPSPCSDDHAERHAAGQLLLATVELARRFGVSQVIVPWVELALHRSMSELQRVFARVGTLPLDDVDAERSSFGESIAEQLLQWLDPALANGSTEGVSLLLCTPAVWPHQAPNAPELTRLAMELEGAPLGLLRGTDWTHARTHLRGEERVTPQGPAPLPVDVAALCAQSGVALTEQELGLLPTVGGKKQAAPLEVTCLRVADASGLCLRLPPGLGEVETALLSQEAADLPAVLWLDPLSPSELGAALDCLNED